MELNIIITLQHIYSHINTLKGKGLRKWINYTESKAFLYNSWLVLIANFGFFRNIPAQVMIITVKLKHITIWTLWLCFKSQGEMLSNRVHQRDTCLCVIHTLLADWTLMVKFYDFIHTAIMNLILITAIRQQSKHSCGTSSGQSDRTFCDKRPWGDHKGWLHSTQHHDLPCS